MIAKKQFQSDGQFYESLKNIMETYTFIAASRVGRIRRSVVANRDFLLEIDRIYQEIKQSYQDQVDKLKNRSRSQGLLGLLSGKKDKTALVFISSNMGLYGDIVKKVFESYLQYVSTAGSNNDLVIIGQRGKNLFADSGLKLTPIFFDMSDDDYETEGLKKIVDLLASYKDVIVFYGQFESIASQVAKMSDISGGTKLQTQQKSGIKYLFEPSLPEIVKFFESQIFTSLFVQTIFESRLAKYASRMNYLDYASEQINSRLKVINVAKIAWKHHFQNTKQMETLSGSALWK